MVKTLLALCAFSCGAWAQSLEQSPIVVPDFKVTEISVAQALRDYPLIIDTADYERIRLEIIRHRPSPVSGYCFRMRQRQIPIHGCDSASRWRLCQLSLDQRNPVNTTKLLLLRRDRVNANFFPSADQAYLSKAAGSSS
jgi:hypothetical protein